MVEQRPEKPCVGTSDKGEVGGSSPPTPTILKKEVKFRELAQMARALGLGPRGREFESRIPEVMYV